MSPALDAIRLATIGTPYEGRLFVVGGAVRDVLLSRPLKNDFDLVTELDALALAKSLHEKGVSGPAEVYPRFGTAMVRIEGSTIEFVTARKESYEDDSRKPHVEPATLLDDARRRDFTVNALMRNLHTGELLDMLGTGIDDLEGRLLRTPLDPKATFYDDPLRMLRAVRFKWTLGFEYVPELRTALAEESGRLRVISAERIRDELTKMLLLPDADRALDELREFGLLRQFAPELEAMLDVEQGKYHHLDVWRHSLMVVKNAGPGDLILTLACLLHDVGKPPTRTIDKDGNTRFFGHESVGAKMALEIVRRLKFSQDDADAVALLVRNHMRLGSAPNFTPSAARRLIRDLGEHLDRLLQLVEADANALKKGVRVFDLEQIKKTLAKVQLVTPRETLESPLSGQEIMEALGLSQGPEVGAIKARLTEMVLDGTLASGDKEGALQAILP